MLERVFARRFGPAVVGVFFALSVAACGGEQESGGNAPEDTGGATNATEESVAGGKTSAGETTAEETTVAEERELARVEVGPDEITNMTPADGEEPDEPQPLPENPPEGIEVFPATTNETVEGEIEYARRPPTNGDHDPLWQNCGYYPEPIDDRTAVHSMDHGVVWISYRPDLPAGEVETLRGYGDEEYVIVSPYPGLPAPVVATAWRVQLRLDGADDPRLRQFVDQFRNTELAPLSGNRCVDGVGEPEMAP